VTILLQPVAQAEQRRGVSLAVLAYLVWGFAGLYWLETKPVAAIDLIAHRALWSLPVLIVCLLWMQRLGAALKLLRQPRSLAILTVSAGLQATNWGIFVWAVTHEHASEASLGYCLWPLLNVAVGLWVFKETVNSAQKIAIALAIAGLLLIVFDRGGMPWVALGVAFSFGCYGAVRKKIAIEAVEGLFVETMLMAPLALAWLWLSSWGGLGQHGGRVDLFLLGSGLITVVPLVCYVVSSRLLPLTALGLVFYLGPTCQLFVAVCILGEPLSPVQLIAFGLVWLGLGCVVIDTLRRYRSVGVIYGD